MSVSAVYAPPQLTPVRSNAWLVLSGSNFETHEPIGAIIWIIFENPSAAGNTIQMAFPERTVLMTCAATPDDSGTQFAPGPGGVVESAANFEAGLLSNPFITEHYRVTRSGWTVAIEGIEAGEAWALIGQVVTPPTLATVGNQNGGGQFQTLNPNYGIVIRPYVLNGSTWEQRRDRNVIPGPDLFARVDLQEILRHECSGDWPALSTGGAATLHTTSARPYYLEMFERYGEPATARRVYRFGTPTAPKLAWLAGAQRHSHESFRIHVNTRILGTMPPHLFLTWRNRTARRKVTMGEQHYLGWFHWAMEATPASFYVQAKVLCTDGTVVDWTDRYGQPVATVAKRERVISWAVGYTQLNIGALIPVGKVCRNYSVRINEVETGPKSEEITFWVDDIDENQVFIQYVNSLGVVESLRTRGAWSETITHTYGEMRRHLNYEDRALTDKGAYIHEPLGGQRVLTVFTDHHERTEHADILDLLGSPEIKLVDYANNRRLPLRLTEETEARIFGRGDPEENLHGADIVFLLDDPEAVVTRQVTGPQVTANESDGGTSEEGGGGGGGEDP